MCVAKFEAYNAYLEILESHGIRYQPLIFSCFGRLHPDSIIVFNNLVQAGVRRHGLSDGRSLLRRTQLKNTSNLFDELLK